MKQLLLKRRRLKKQKKNRMDTLVIVILIVFIVGKLTWNRAYKKGKEECEGISYNDGYKNGVKCVEDEIRELIKLPDEDIIERIKKFAKKEVK